MRTYYEHHDWSAVTLATLMRNKKIFLDDAFQSYHRWVTENNQQYMRSLLNGKAPTPIYVADIEACRNSIRLKYGENHEDYKFFDDLLKKGYKYITIDGNNRTRCITDFIFGCLTGNFPLYEQDYEIGGSITRPIVFTATKQAKSYNQLDPQFANEIDNIKFTVTVITTGTRRDLAELFDSINKGITLNAQEKRNCLMYTFAYDVRECVAKNKSNLKLIFKGKDDKVFHRRVVDEFVVDVACLCARGLIGFGPANRDKAYGDNTPEVLHFKKAERIIKQIASLAKFIKDGDKLLISSKKTSTNLVDLAILLNYMNDNEIDYSDKEKFFTEFCNAQEERLADPTILWRKKFPKGHPQEGQPTGTDDRGYAGVQRSAAQVNFLTIRQDKLIASLKDFSDGLIVYKDPQRNFKRDYAFMIDLWKSQNEICPLSDKKIYARDVMNGQIIEVDHHFIPHSKGGQTVKENAALVYKSANREKSDKITNDTQLRVTKTYDDLVA